MAKKANPVLFHILKAIVDYKVPYEKKILAEANRAASDVYSVQKDINSLEIVISNARRYDPSEVAEYEESLAWHENNLNQLNLKVERGQAAKKQLAAADQFYALFRREIEAPAAALLAARQRQEIDKQIAVLNNRREKLEAEEAYLDSQMDQCYINIDTYPEQHDVYIQSQHDLEWLRHRYENTMLEMKSIYTEIQNLQQQKRGGR